MRSRLFGLTLWLLAALAQAQDVIVWSGGVGSDERASAPATGTKLEFFAESGDFVAKVHVVIKDGSGKAVVDTVCNGPWLVLNLPQGDYQLRAEVSGKQQSLKFAVGAAPQKIGVRFPGL